MRRPWHRQRIRNDADRVRPPRRKLAGLVFACLALCLLGAASALHAQTPATGAPEITGTAQVGQTLTAGIGTIADTDGLTTKTFPDDYTFQWSREDADGTNPADITSATSTTYRLVAADQGKKVKVKVTFRDDAGHDEELTSAAWPSGTDTVANDTTAPTLVSRTVNGATVVLTFSEELDDTSVPAASAFILFPLTVSNIAVVGRTMTITVSPPVAHGDRRLISYAKPSTNPLKDLSGNEVATFNSLLLTNLTPNPVPPEFIVATVNGTALVMQYDIDLDEASVPAAGAFAVKVEGAARDLATMTPVAVTGRRVTLTLGSAATAGQAVTVSYTPPVSNPLRSTAGLDAIALTDESVVNVSGDTAAPTLVRAVAETTFRVVLTYDELLDEASVPATSVFTVLREGDTTPRTLIRVEVRGREVTLRLLAEGRDLSRSLDATVSYTPPSMNPLQDVVGNDAEALSNRSITTMGSANRVAIGTATVNGAALVLTYDRNLEETAVPGADAFTVKVTPSGGGMEQERDLASMDPVTVSGRTVTLTLDSPVAPGDTVTVSYAVPTGPFADPIQSPLAILAGVFTDRAVTNNTVGNTEATGAPAITGTAQVGQTLTAGIGTIADSDGLPTTTFPAGYTFQWSREDADGTNPADITGATSQTYTLAAADLGKKVRVKVSFTDGASNDEERTSAASETVRAANAAPVFADDALTREVAENTAADTHIGAVIPEATDDDGDTLTYTMEGTDKDAFTFDDSTRQLKTKAGVDYDFETKASYSVTVRATDPAGASDTVAVTINLLNLPAVSIARQQARVLMTDGLVRFTFSAPTRPPSDLSINLRAEQDHAWFSDVQLGFNAQYDRADNDWFELWYRFDDSTLGGLSPVESGDFTVTILPGEGYELGAVTSQTVEIVAGDPLITVRALEATKTVAEGVGTVTLTLRAETIANAPKPTSHLNFDWSTRPDTALGGGTDFENAASGTTGIGFLASDFTQHGNVWRLDKTVSVTINDDSLAERSDEQFHIEMTRRGITHRLVKLANADGTFCEDNATGVNCGATVVITDNDNRAPVFPDSAGTRSVPENSPAGTAVGAPVAATDEDGHTLTYTIDGTDKESFDFDTATGRISTKTGVDYDHETKDAYAVTVTAQDPVGARASVDVAISVGDVDEKPQTPAAPVVNATLGTPTEITIGWTKPGLDGGPDIIGYEVQYRQAGEIAWIDVTHDTTQTEATVGSLPINVEYEARVRALNGETPSDWSPPGRGASGTPEGTIELIVAPASAEEGGTVAWRVRATSEEDERPRADLDMRVQVTGVDVSAVAGEDFGVVDRTLTFVRGDFTRRAVNGQMRWVAEKSGTVRITDEAEVETDETFAIEMSLASGRGNWSIGAHRAEVSIPNTDTWAIELTAQPSTIAEAETRPVTLTATVVPTGQGCVAGFPFTLGLAVGGTASNPADYRIEGADALQVAACQASATWTVTLASKADLVADDAETVTFTPVVAGADAFEAPRLRGAQVTIDEAPGLALDTFALAIEEGGDASYTVVLIKRPSGTVTVTPSVSGDSDVTVSGPLTFTRESWNVAQRITVSAAHDSDDEHDTATVSLRASGADYGGVTGADVRVEVDDDEASQGVLSARLSNGPVHVDAARGPRPLRRRARGEPRLAAGDRGRRCGVDGARCRGDAARERGRRRGARADASRAHALVGALAGALAGARRRQIRPRSRSPASIRAKKGSEAPVRSARSWLSPLASRMNRTPAASSGFDCGRAEATEGGAYPIALPVARGSRLTDRPVSAGIS